WCIGRRQVVGDRHETARFSDHHLGISAIMMNAGVFLVPAVHEIAVAAELAIATRAVKKPNPHALTDRPALNAGTKGIEAPGRIMAWDPGPIDRKQARHRAGIRVANPTRLDANAYLIGTGIQKWLPYFREFSGSRDCDRSVCSVHTSSDLECLRGGAALGRELLHARVSRRAMTPCA